MATGRADLASAAAERSEGAFTLIQFESVLAEFISPISRSRIEQIISSGSLSERAALLNFKASCSVLPDDDRQLVAMLADLSQDAIRLAKNRRESCRELEQAETASEYNYLKIIDDSALRGDAAAQALYLRALVDAVSGRVINPATEPDFAAKRDRAIRWQEALSRSGSASASLALAIEYDRGLIVRPDSVKRYLFARRAFELGGGGAARSMFKFAEAGLQPNLRAQADNIYRAYIK